VKAITIINIANGVLVENEQGTLSVKRRLQRIIPSSCWPGRRLCPKLGIVGLHSSLAVGFISKSVPALYSTRPYNDVFFTPRGRASIQFASVPERMTPYRTSRKTTITTS